MLEVKRKRGLAARLKEGLSTDAAHLLSHCVRDLLTIESICEDGNPRLAVFWMIVDVGALKEQPAVPSFLTHGSRPSVVMIP